MKHTMKRKKLIFLLLFLSVFIFSSSAYLHSDPLFDIQIIIPNEYLEITAGDELFTTIQLINLGSEGRVDVYLNYYIVDAETERNIIVQKKETVAVETQAHFVKSFLIPEKTESGSYVLYVQLIYADSQTAVAKHSFFVSSKASYKLPLLLLGIGVSSFFVYKIIFSNFLQKYVLRQRVHRIVRKKKYE